ncbi:MAG: tRNA lysidine(34) synthetase TilS [Rhodospirillales bacterium]|nr:tRNA lysidine(34) synthetase TilS [Rhodospirillales bacterium]
MHLTPDQPRSLTGPLTFGEFAARMAALAPFERNPHLAVAVSGGSDSMALCLLADGWARARGGRVMALTVDHGLRPDSMKEAEKVGRWLAARGIDHTILSWSGPKPASGIQAAAREARYRLLLDWARSAGVLHLCLAHQLEDQAETFLMRLGRGSGLDGLAAMSAISEKPAARLIRPLLEVPRARLQATLKDYGQEWIEDPSNDNPAYARTRIRADLKSLAGEGISPAHFARTAQQMAQARAALEHAASGLIASSARLHPAGFVRMNRDMLRAAPAEVSLRALVRTVRCIGGGAYAPKREKMDRLHEQLLGDDPESNLAGGRTLGGCRIVPGGGEVLICREVRGQGQVLAARPGVRALWDNRFVIHFGNVRGESDAAAVSRLGGEGWAEVVSVQPDLKGTALPGPVRASLPVLRDKYGIITVPHLAYRRPERSDPAQEILKIVFSPPNPLSGAGFFVA